MKVMTVLRHCYYECRRLHLAEQVLKQDDVKKWLCCCRGAACSVFILFFFSLNFKPIHSLDRTSSTPRHRDPFQSNLKQRISPLFSLGMEYNFYKINTLNQGTPYDYNSVMQYER